MTDRYTVNTITSDALDQLYADLDQARQHTGSLDAPLHAQLQAAIKALGTSETELAQLRGQLADTARSRDEWKWRAEDAKRGTRCQRERAERAETAVTQVHQLLATGQIGCCAHLVRTALDTTPAPAAKPESWLAAGTRDLSIPTRHAFTARPVDPDTERAATERAVQAAADSEKSAAWFAAHSQPAPAATEATEPQEQP